MKTRIIRTAALALTSVSLLAACKKGADEAPTESAAAPSAPIDVAPVPVEQDGVFRYADEIAVTGQAKTNAKTNFLKGTDADSAVVASLDADAVVEKKARRGDHVLVSWSAEPGQPSMGWTTTSSLIDQGLEPVILPVDAGTDAPSDQADAEAAATDAGKAEDAGQAESADAGTDTDEAAADEKAADAGTSAATEEDAGSGESAAAADAGSGDETKAETDADAGDGSKTKAGLSKEEGGMMMRVPTKKDLPVLKLPGKLQLEPKPKE